MVDISLSFSLTSILFYIGWFIVFIGISSLYIIGSLKYGSEFMSIISLLYMIMFASIGNHMWYIGSEIFGGLLIMSAICMVPLTIISSAKNMHDERKDWYEEQKLRVMAEIGTLSAACLALYKYEGFTFFVAIIAMMIWVLSEEFMVSLQQSNNINYLKNYGFFERTFKFVIEIFGILMVLTAYKIDSMNLTNDYSFWLYLIGLLSCWISLTTRNDGGSLLKFIYGIMNIMLILIWIFWIQRNIFLLLGLSGILLYQMSDIIIFRNEKNENEKNGYDKISYQIIYDILIIGLAYVFEINMIKTPILDLTFWLYINGTIMLWIEMMVKFVGKRKKMAEKYRVHEEIIVFISLLFNIGYVLLSIQLVKIVFLIFGTIGITYYITHAMNKIFNETLTYSTGLIMIGISIMTCSEFIKNYYFN